MLRNEDEELREINKKLVMLNIIDAPGAILLGLGLYGVFGSNGDAFIEMLNDRNLAYAAIAVGTVIIVTTGVKIIALAKRKREILRDENT